MKRLLAYLLLLSFLIISLSACGSSTGAPGTPAPTPLAVQIIADAGNAEVTLDWQMVANDDTYNIYVGTSASSLTKITTVPASLLSAPYTVTALSNGTSLSNNTTYYFAISAVNASNVESALSSPISATPSATPPPAAPKNIRANAGNGYVTVTWTPVADTVSYNIYCYWQESLTNLGVSDPIPISGQASDSAVVSSVTWFSGSDNGVPIAGKTTSLTNGTTYYFYVTAVNASNVESSASFFDSATPSTTPPPFAPVLTSVSPGSFTINNVNYNTEVTWEAPVTGTAASYNIYIGKASGVTKETGAVTNVSAAPPLQAGANLASGKYYIVVTAVDSDGNESAESNELSVTIP
ncbi:MAG: hypothetical protein ACLQBQ_13670 [Smithella sp.]